MVDELKGPDAPRETPSISSNSSALIEINSNSVSRLLSVDGLDGLASVLGISETAEMSQLRMQAVENMKQTEKGGKAYSDYELLGQQLIIESDPEKTQIDMSF